MAGINWSRAREELAPLVDDEAAEATIAEEPEVLTSPLAFRRWRSGYLRDQALVAIMAHGWQPMTGEMRLDDKAENAEATTAAGRMADALKARAMAWSAFDGQLAPVWPGLRDERRDKLVKLFKDEVKLRQLAAVYDVGVELDKHQGEICEAMTVVLYWLKEADRGQLKLWLKVAHRLEADALRLDKVDEGACQLLPEDEVEWS